MGILKIALIILCSGVVCKLIARNSKTRCIMPAVQPSAVSNLAMCLLLTFGGHH